MSYFARAFAWLIGLTIIPIAVTQAAEPAVAPVVPAVSVSSANDDVINVFVPGRPLAWQVKVASRANDAAIASQVKWRLEGWSGPTGTGGTSKLVDGGARIEFTPDRLGWTELVVSAQTAMGESIGEGRVAFSVSPKVKSNGHAFRYGVNAHTRRAKPDGYAKEVALAGALGIDIIRDGIGWEGIQRDGPDAWDFSKFDALISSMSAHGIEVQGTLMFTALWATTIDPSEKDWNKKNKSAPKLDPYLTYVRKTVDRYKGRIHTWEIWNEPDIGFWLSPTEQFIELFNAASRAVKETDPNAQVLNGGFAMVSREPNPTFISDFLKGVDRTNWDVWVYHDYHTFPQMLARNREHRAQYASIDSHLPVWINEGGFHDLNIGGRREQAVTLVKKYSTAPALGIGAYIWYDLHDDGIEPTEPEHHFGLVTNDYQPKPGYAALQTLIGQLAPRKFERQLTEVPSGVFAQLYSGGDAPASEHVLVLWREGKNRTTPTWIATAGPVTAATDIMGNAVPFTPYAGGTVVTLSDEPIYLRFGGATTSIRVEPVLVTPDKVVLTPDAASELPIGILNPSTAAQDITVHLSTDMPGVTLTPSERQLSIRAGASSTFSATAVQSAAAVAVTGRVTVNVMATGQGSVFSATIPTTTALVIPSLAEAPADAEIPVGAGLVLTLGDRDDIHNLFSAQPALDMRWNGVTDLSAVARIVHGSLGLRLEVVVRDDVHNQTNRGERLWMGDSLQLAIQPNDSRPGMLELTIGQTEQATVDGWVFARPTGTKGSRGPTGNEFPATVHRNDDKTIYDLTIPWSSLGLTSPPASSFRLNFIVNDDDGKGRKQWVQLSPGIGEGKTPEKFKVFVCR